MHADVFRRFKMLAAYALHAFCHVAVGPVVGGAGIARNHRDLAPFAAAESRLLIKLALGCRQRVLAGVYAACHKLIACLVDAVAVLAYHHKLPVGGHRDDVDPVGIFKHIKFGYLGAVGQTHHVAACRQPRTTEQIFAAHKFPFPFVNVCFQHIVVSFFLCQCFLTPL